MRKFIAVLTAILSVSSWSNTYLTQCSEHAARPYELPAIIEESKNSLGTIFAVSGSSIVFPNQFDLADVNNEILGCFEDIDDLSAEQRIIKTYLFQNEMNLSNNNTLLEFKGTQYQKIDGYVARNSAFKKGLVTIPESILPGQCLTLSEGNETYNIRVDGFELGCTGDLNTDGIVDIDDFLEQAGQLGSTDLFYDLNCDGQVNNQDAQVIINRFNQTCSAINETEVEIACQSDFNSDGVVNIDDFLAFSTHVGTQHSLYDLNSDDIVDSTDLNILEAEFNQSCVLNSEIKKTAVVTVDIDTHPFTENEIAQLTEKFDNYMYGLDASGSNRINMWTNGQVTFARDSDLDGEMDYLGHVQRMIGRSCDLTLMDNLAREKFDNYDSYDSVLFIFSKDFACFFNARIQDDFIGDPSVSLKAFYRSDWLLEDEQRINGIANANHIVSHELGHFFGIGHSAIANKIETFVNESPYSALGDNKTNFDYLDFPNAIHAQRFQDIDMDYIELDVSNLTIIDVEIADIYNLSQSGKKGIHIPTSKLDTVYSASTNFRPRDYFISYTTKVQDQTPRVFIHTGSSYINFAGTILLKELSIGENYIDENNKLSFEFVGFDSDTNQAQIRASKIGSALTDCALPLNSNVTFDFSNVSYNSATELLTADYTVSSAIPTFFGCPMASEFVVRIRAQDVINEQTSIGPIRESDDTIVIHDLSNGQVGTGSVALSVSSDQFVRDHFRAHLYAWRPKTNSNHGYEEYENVKREGEFSKFFVFSN